MENKIIVFGDIHGHFKAAERAIRLANEEKATAVFLGDYIDRGPNSIKTLEILLDAKKLNSDWFFLRGNHDQMLLDLILGKQLPNMEFDVFSGRTSNSEASKVFLKLQELPSSKQIEITNFLESTLFYFETDDWIFVHAPLKDSNVPLPEKLNDELIWNYTLDPIWQGKPFIHGHAVVDKPTNTHKGLNINTGCGFGGFLTGTLIKLFNPDSTNKQPLENTLINFFISETGEKLDNNS